jgi:hypothetical protein
MEPVTTIIITVSGVINSLSTLFTALSEFIPTAIGCASILAAIFPKPEGDGKLAKIHKFINTLAFNFKNAANKE